MNPACPACPACAVATRAIQKHELTGFECAKCNGHYIPGGALDDFLNVRGIPRKFTELMEQAQEAPASTRALVCPYCRQNSFHVVLTGIVKIDICNICVGIYLDRGEASTYVFQIRGTTEGEDCLDEIKDKYDFYTSLLSIFRLGK